MFWMKKKTIIVDAFTDNIIVAKNPISPTVKNLPAWYKKLKPTFDINDNGHKLSFSTFKRCDGMLDLIGNSFTLPMWADLSVVVDENGGYQWKYPSQHCNFGVENHAEIQTDSAFSPFVHMKILSPWVLREKTGVSFYQTQAFYSLNELTGSVIMPPGVVNYKYQNSTHINMFLQRNKHYLFEAGQGMTYLIPITENEVEIKTHVVSTQEYKQLSTPHNFKFMGSYKYFKGKSCPFTGRSE